jgi:hypothetical protein
MATNIAPHLNDETTKKECAAANIALVVVRSNP